MFSFIFVIFSYLQSYTLGVSLRPNQSDIGIWTEQQVFVTCSRDDNEENGTLKWINPYGKEIEDNINSGVYVSGGHSESSLRLFLIKTMKRDGGEYKCEFIKNRKVLSSTSFNLHVYKSIEMSGDKEYYIGEEGETITITCIVKFDYSGTDNQIMWSFNNNVIINGSDQFFSRTVETTSISSQQLTVSNSLIIRNLTQQNEGEYICRAVTVNPYLSQMKIYQIYVRVMFRPHFPINAPEYVWISDTTYNSPIFINVTCIVNADPVASIRWFTGDRIRIKNGKLKDKAKVSNTENLSVLSLEYENLQEINDSKSDPLGYLRKLICEATNDLGIARKTYELKVGPLPTPPIITNHFFNNGLLTFTLKDSYIDPPVDIYRIEISAQYSIYFYATNDVRNNTYVLELNIPEGVHQLMITAHNPVGWSAMSNEMYFSTVKSGAHQYLSFQMIGCLIVLANSFVIQ